MERENSLIVSLDIGTYKTAVIVAEPSPEGIEVIGVGMALSQGLRKGLVLNVEATVPVIRKAIEEAEVGASCEIHNVCLSLTGGFIEGFSSQGVVAVKDQEVAGVDVGQVIDVARAVALPPDREILHVLPQEFLVDGQSRGRDPVGAAGVRLEADVYIITVATNATQTLLRCCERADLQVRSFSLAVLAAAEAVLTPEEKELGVVLLDIGAGTTGVVVFHRGAIVHTAMLPIGANHITNDLAAGLRTPMAETEKLKQRHGCALVDLLTPGEMIEMPRVGGRDPAPVLRRRLSEIIELRVQEIFTLVKEQLSAIGMLDKLGSGVVLTGGGAIMTGMPELAERVFRLLVRRGAPPHLSGLVDEVNGPMYATGVGLVLRERQKTHLNGTSRTPLSPHGWQRMRDRVAEWFRDFF